MYLTHVHSESMCTRGHASPFSQLRGCAAHLRSTGFLGASLGPGMRGFWAQVPILLLTSSFLLAKGLGFLNLSVSLCRTETTAVLVSLGRWEDSKDTALSSVRVRVPEALTRPCKDLGMGPFSVAGRCHRCLRQLWKLSLEGRVGDSPNLPVLTTW